MKKNKQRSITRKNNWRTFTVSIHEKPLVYMVRATSKKDAEREAIFKYSYQGNTQNVQKIKVRNGGDE